MIPTVYQELEELIRNVITHTTDLYGVRVKVWRTATNSVFGDYGQSSRTLVRESKLLVTGFLKLSYGYYAPDRDTELTAWTTDDDYSPGDYLEIEYNNVVYRYVVTSIQRIGTLNNLFQLTIVPTQEVV